MSLQISVPKEIKEYKQVVAFGLTLKQLLWCGAGVLTGVGVFFFIKDKIALDIVAIVCMVSAIPFALMGFVNYNGMDAWELFVQWFKVTFLMRPLKYESTNYYKDLLLSSNEELIYKFQFKEREVDPKIDKVENPINSKPPKKPIKSRFLEFINKYKFLILVLVLILSFIALGIINKVNKSQVEKPEQTSTTKKVVTTTTTVAPTTTTQKPIGVIPIPENSKGKATTTLIENKTTTTTTVAPTTTTTVATTRATQAPIQTTTKVIQNTSQTKVRETVKTENNEVFDPIIETLPPKN